MTTRTNTACAVPIGRFLALVESGELESHVMALHIDDGTDGNLTPAIRSIIFCSARDTVESLFGSRVGGSAMCMNAEKDASDQDSSAGEAITTRSGYSGMIVPESAVEGSTGAAKLESAGNSSTNAVTTHDRDWKQATEPVVTFESITGSSPTDPMHDAIQARISAHRTIPTVEIIKSETIASKIPDVSLAIA
eukprot:IDg10447t1